MSAQILRVLAVEDNPADLRLLQETLKECPTHDFEITGCRNMVDALAVLSKEKFDVILLDLDLPDSKGLNNIERVSSADPAIPIIVLTGLDDEKTGIQALSMHAQDYLIKNSFHYPVLEKSIIYAIERKRAKEALRASEENARKQAAQLRATFDAAPAMIWMALDRDCQTIIGNRYASDFSRVPEGINMSKSGPAPEKLSHYRILKDGKELAPCDLPIQQVARTGKGLTDYTLDFVFDDGTKRSLVGNISPILDLKGDPVGAVAVFIDITARKRAEEILKRDKYTFEKLVEERTRELFDAQVQLEKTKRLTDIGTLAATVAHELRNPLAAISLAAHNIKRKADITLIGSHLHSIEKKVSESDQIINNLLFYSRLKTPHCELIYIEKIVHECVNILPAQSKGKMISVRIDLSDLEDVAILADPLQMKELFSNVLNNSRDALPEQGGEINILGESTGDSIKITIRDNGAGIEKEHLDKIFDPFFTTKTKGTGLGLTVCRQIVDMHDGSIQIESRPGIGTDIVIILQKERKKEYKLLEEGC